MSGNVGKVLSLSGTDDVEQAALMLEVAEQIVAPLAVGSALRDMISECLAAHYVSLGGGRVKASERLPDWTVSYLTTEQPAVDRTGPDGADAVWHRAGRAEPAPADAGGGGGGVMMRGRDERGRAKEQRAAAAREKVEQRQERKRLLRAQARDRERLVAHLRGRGEGEV